MYSIIAKVGQISQMWDVMNQHLAQQVQVRAQEDQEINNPDIRTQDADPSHPKIDVRRMDIYT